MKKIALIILVLFGLIGVYAYAQSSQAEDGHDHSGHLEEEHEDGHDEHDEHGHEDEHGHGHDDDHDEDKTEIEPEQAKQAGVILSKAQGGTIAKNISLTGQIVLNANRSADVNARFTGVVKSVKAELGQQVKKGQVLATVESNESLQLFNVTAPLSGTILTRNINIGRVTGDAPLFTIADVSTVWARFHVFPKDAGQVKQGQSVTVHSLGSDKKQTSAPIKMLLPTADAYSQTYVAIVEVDNEQSIWRPGMTVEGNVAVSQENAALIVPTSAIQTIENQSVIFVEHNNSYEMRPVKIGKTDNQNVQILSGLTEDESYVSQGSFIIKADILKSGAAHEH